MSRHAPAPRTYPTGEAAFCSESIRPISGHAKVICVTLKSNIARMKSPRDREARTGSRTMGVHFIVHRRRDASVRPQVGTCARGWSRNCVSRRSRVAFMRRVATRACAVGDGNGGQGATALGIFWTTTRRPGKTKRESGYASLSRAAAASGREIALRRSQHLEADHEFLHRRRAQQRRIKVRVHLPFGVHGAAGRLLVEAHRIGKGYVEQPVVALREVLQRCGERLSFGGISVRRSRHCAVAAESSSRTARSPNTEPARRSARSRRRCAR